MGIIGCQTALLGNVSNILRSFQKPGDKSHLPNENTQLNTQLIASSSLKYKQGFQLQYIELPVHFQHQIELKQHDPP